MIKKGTPQFERANRRAMSPGVLIGQQLVRAGKLAEADIPQIVAVQGKTKTLFGETAVKLGLTTQEDVQEMLARQFDYSGTVAEVARLDAALVTAHDPTCARSEAFRTLRTEIILRQETFEGICLAIVSSSIHDRADLLAANLAIVFAQLGRRTMLIDANFRLPSQQILFGLQPGPGLSGVLNGRSEFSSLLELSPLKNLVVLRSGATPPNPQELLSRSAFGQIVQHARSEFEVVILDTPPLPEYADAKIVASHAGACLLATRRNTTPIADIKKVMTSLESTGAKLVGAALLD